MSSVDASALAPPAVGRRAVRLPAAWDLALIASWALYSVWIVLLLLTSPPFIEQGDLLWSYFPTAALHLQGIGILAFLVDTYRGPGYPFLLALMSGPTGNLPAAARWIDLAGWPLWLAVIALTMRQVAGPVPALVTLWLISLSDGLVFVYQEPGTDLPFALLAAVTTWVALQRSRRAWLVAGLLAALATLTRYQGAVLFGAVALGSPLIWVRRRSDLRSWLLALAGFSLTFLLCVGPYLYLNNLYHGSPWFSRTVENIPDDWRPAGVTRVPGGTTLFRETATGREPVTSIPQVILIDPVRVLGKWTEQATVKLITDRLPCVLPGSGCDSVLGRVLALAAPVGLAILLWRSTRPPVFFLWINLALLWTSVAISFREPRHLLTVIPLACLALAALLLPGLSGVIRWAATARGRPKGGAGLGRRLLGAEPGTPPPAPRHPTPDTRYPTPSLPVVIGAGGLCLLIGLTFTWLPIVPTSSVARLWNDWSLPSAASREVPGFLAAFAAAGGDRPVADFQSWAPLTWYLPAETGGRFRSVWPDSVLAGTSPYRVYEKFLWTAVIRQDGREADDNGWDKRLPLGLPPEAEIDASASEWLDLTVAPAVPQVLEIEDFAGMTMAEYPADRTPGTWLIWHYQPWMSNNGVAVLLGGAGPGPTLTRPVDLAPGRSEVALRALAFAPGAIQARLTVGDATTTFEGVLPGEQPITFTQTITLTSPATSLSLSLADLGPPGLALDAVTIRPLAGAQPINRVWLMPWPDGGLPGEIEIETSADGLTWRPAVRRTDLRQVRQSPITVPFPETTAGYLRIVGRRLTSSDGLPATDPNKRQWMGFVAVRARLARESPWATVAPAVDVDPRLEISPDGWVTARDFTTPGAPPGTWPRWSYQPWMSGNSTAGLLVGPALPDPLTRPIDLNPGTSDVVLRALSLGQGLARVGVQIGDSDAIFAWDGPSEQPITLTQRVTLRASARQLTLRVEALAARALALVSLTLLPAPDRAG